MNVWIYAWTYVLVLSYVCIKLCSIILIFCVSMTSRLIVQPALNVKNYRGEHMLLYSIVRAKVIGHIVYIILPLPLKFHHVFGTKDGYALGWPLDIWNVFIFEIFLVSPASLVNISKNKNMILSKLTMKFRGNHKI